MNIYITNQTININKMNMTMADNAFVEEVETPASVPEGNYQLIVNDNASLSLFPGTSEIITMFKQSPLTWSIRKPSDNPTYYNISTSASIGFMGNENGQLMDPILIVASPSKVWDFDIKGTMNDGSYIVTFRYVLSNSLYLVQDASDLDEGVQCVLNSENNALKIRLKPVG